MAPRQGYTSILPNLVEASPLLSALLVLNTFPNYINGYRKFILKLIFTFVFAQCIINSIPWNYICQNQMAIKK